MPHKAPSKKAGSLSLPTEQDLPRSNSVKTEYDSCQDLPWLSQIKKPLGLCSTVHLQMVAKLSALFLWKNPANGSEKTGRTEMGRRTNGKIQECQSQGQGKCNPHWKS